MIFTARIHFIMYTHGRRILGAFFGPRVDEDKLEWKNVPWDEKFEKPFPIRDDFVLFVAQLFGYPVGFKVNSSSDYSLERKSHDMIFGIKVQAFTDTIFRWVDKGFFMTEWGAFHRLIELLPDEFTQVVIKTRTLYSERIPQDEIVIIDGKEVKFSQGTPFTEIFLRFYEWLKAKEKENPTKELKFFTFLVHVAVHLLMLGERYDEDEVKRRYTKFTESFEEHDPVEIEKREEQREKERQLKEELEAEREANRKRVRDEYDRQKAKEAEEAAKKAAREKERRNRIVEENRKKNPNMYLPISSSSSSSSEGEEEEESSSSSSSSEEEEK